MSANAGTAAASLVANASSSAGTYHWIIAVLVVLAAGFSIAGFSMITSYAASNENSYQKVKDQMAKILGISFGGAFCLAIASLLFFYSSPKYAVLFQIVLLVLCFFLSFGALATAALKNA